MLKQVTNFTILYFEKRDEFYISYQHNSSKFNMKAPLYKIEYALLNKGLINKEQLDKAKDVQVKEHIRLEDALVKLGFLTYSVIIQFFSSQYDLPVIDLDKTTISPEIINLIPIQHVKKHHILPVSKDNGVITIAVSSPPDLGFIDNLRFMFNADFKCVLATPENIKKAINKYYELEPTETVDTLLQELKVPRVFSNWSRN